MHPLVPMENDLLTLEPHPKILGVTFDPYLRFHKHVEALVTKAKGKLNLLKALTGTTWGQQKDIGGDLQSSNRLHIQLRRPSMVSQCQPL